MSRVLVTGSSDGLGLLAANMLCEQGHDVVLHARSDARASDARKAVPRAAGVVVGDFASIAEMRRVADQANAIGPFDAVIHNAGIYRRGNERGDTVDGLEPIFAVNVLAPFVLTAIMERPARVVVMSSGLHRSGVANLRDLQRRKRGHSEMQAYSDSKLYDVMLAFAIARLWPAVFSNAVNPGWVPTKMGGRGAPDDLTAGATTQAWLATSEDAAARVTGKYFFHQKIESAHPSASDVALQDELLAYCGSLTGVSLPSLF